MQTDYFPRTVNWQIKIPTIRKHWALFQEQRQLETKTFYDIVLLGERRVSI